MSAIIASLSDLVTMLRDTFRLPSLFPSLIFIGLNRLFVVPHFAGFPLVSKLMSLDLNEQALLYGALAILLGYTLTATEVPIVRLYEGYPWRDSWIGQLMTGWQLGRRERMEGEYPLELDRSFPGEARVLPTKLGNVVAAFEAYPMQKYKMDGVTFWPRIYPILVKQDFAPHIIEHRSTLDFLLNTSFLMGAFGLECIVLRLFILPNISGVLPMVSLSAAFIFYQAAIGSAYNWGDTFRAAFDLFRYQLAQALGLKPVKSYREERVMWQEISKFWRLQPDIKFSRFAHLELEQDWPINNSKPEGSEK